MNLVDDIYSVFQLCGGEGYLILHIPDVIDTVIACGVHLDNVRRGSRIDAATSGAFVAGVTRPGIETVHSLRQNLGTGGFTCTARAGKQIRMAHFICQKLCFNRLCNCQLSYNVIKGLRTIFTI